MKLFVLNVKNDYEGRCGKLKSAIMKLTDHTSPIGKLEFIVKSNEFQAPDAQLDKMDISCKREEIYVDDLSSSRKTYFVINENGVSDRENVVERRIFNFSIPATGMEWGPEEKFCDSLNGEFSFSPETKVLGYTFVDWNDSDEDVVREISSLRNYLSANISKISEKIGMLNKDLETFAETFFEDWKGKCRSDAKFVNKLSMENSKKLECSSFEEVVREMRKFKKQEVVCCDDPSALRLGWKLVESGVTFTMTLCKFKSFCNKNLMSLNFPEKIRCALDNGALETDDGRVSLAKAIKDSCW